MISWERYIQLEEDANEGMCIDNAAHYGIDAQRALDDCEEGSELCPRCPFLRYKPRPKAKKKITRN